MTHFFSDTGWKQIFSRETVCCTAIWCTSSNVHNTYIQPCVIHYTFHFDWGPASLMLTIHHCMYLVYILFQYLRYVFSTHQSVNCLSNSAGSKGIGCVYISHIVSHTMDMK